MIKIETHSADAESLLIPLWRRDQNVKHALRAITRETQALEDLLWRMLSTTVDNATKKDLDDLGGTVGQARAGRSDEVYRRLVRARIAVNRSHGRIADLYNVAKALFSADLSFSYAPPFSISIEVVSDPGWLPDLEKSLLEDAADPVCRIDLHFEERGDLSLLAADGDSFDEEDEDHGLQDGDDFESGTGGLSVGDL